MEREELTERVAKKDDRKARLVLENLNVSQDQDFFSLFRGKQSIKRGIPLENDRDKSCNVISVNILLPQKFYRE